MRRRVLIVIGLGVALNLVLVGVFGYNHSAHDDCAGMELWSESTQRWLTLEPVPEGSELPPCRIEPRKSYEGDFRPV